MGEGREIKKGSVVGERGCSRHDQNVQTRRLGKVSQDDRIVRLGGRQEKVDAGQQETERGTTLQD